MVFVSLDRVEGVESCANKKVKNVIVVMEYVFFS